MSLTNRSDTYAQLSEPSALSRTGYVGSSNLAVLPPDESGIIDSLIYGANQVDRWKEHVSRETRR